MPQLKGNLQKKCWKGGRWLRLSFPNAKEESKWFSFVFKLLGPSQTKGSGAVFKVFAALGGKAGVESSCPAFPTTFLPALPFLACEPCK